MNNLQALQQENKYLKLMLKSSEVQNASLKQKMTLYDAGIIDPPKKPAKVVKLKIVR